MRDRTAGAVLAGELPGNREGEAGRVWIREVARRSHQWRVTLTCRVRPARPHEVGEWAMQTKRREMLGVLLLLGSVGWSGQVAAGRPGPRLDRTVAPRAGAGARPKAHVEVHGGLTLSVTAAKDGSVTLKGDSPAVRFTKTRAADGSIAIALANARDRVRVHAAPDGVTVTRGGRSCRVPAGGADEAAFGRCRTVLATSTAVLAFRRVAAALEEMPGSPLGDGVVLAGALVGWIDGDAGAVGRIARRLATRPSAPRVEAVRWSGASCYSDWEAEVVAAMNDYEACLNALPFWLDPACALPWTIRVEAAWIEFLTCLGLPIAE
jgi:hypothetical protein